MNYKLNISYDGTDFSGWQVQANARTVQGDLQTAIHSIFNDDKINICGSGRTDAGVHAINQIANFNINTKMSEEQIKNALNSKLSNDVFIKKCSKVSDSFNSRFSAKKRHYIYKICTTFDPLVRKYFWYITYDLDKSKLEECSKLLLGEHDFSNYSKASSEKENSNCVVDKARWIFDEKSIYFEIEANRFLHHMVRMLVGTMIEVSKGSLSIKRFEEMLLCNEHKSRIVTSPAYGLYLNKVDY